MQKYKQGLLNSLRDTRIYRSTSHVRSHPLHVTAAVAMMGQGISFILSDSFFDWPPVLAKAENDNSVGAVFFIVGFFLMIWAFDKNESDFWEKALLSTAASFQMALFLIDFFTMINDGVERGDHGTNGALTIFIVIVLAAGMRKRVIGRDRKRA